MITYYRVKGQLTERVERRVPDKLQAHCKKAYRGRYYALQKRADGWWVIAFAGCAWDFATKFPDFNWIKEPSLWHDIFHWLIAKGAISTQGNDVIDRILADDCAERSPKILAPIRAYYIRKATNIVDQKPGEYREVFTA